MNYIQILQSGGSIVLLLAFLTLFVAARRQHVLLTATIMAGLGLAWLMYALYRMNTIEAILLITEADGKAVALSLLLTNLFDGSAMLAVLLTLGVAHCSVRGRAAWTGGLAIPSAYVVWLVPSLGLTWLVSGLPSGWLPWAGAAGGLLGVAAMARAKAADAGAADGELDVVAGFTATGFPSAIAGLGMVLGLHRLWMAIGLVAPDQKTHAMLTAIQGAANEVVLDMACVVAAMLAAVFVGRRRNAAMPQLWSGLAAGVVLGALPVLAGLVPMMILFAGYSQTGGGP